MPRSVFPRLLCLVAVALAAGRAGAQCVPDWVRELEPFPIYDALGPAPNAWYGGWQTPRPQLVDIDADLDLDLFVAEEHGKLRFYRNDGSVAAPDFTFVTDDFGGVHDLYFTRFADADADGDFDLLVEAPPFEVDLGGATVERTGAYLYTNVGDAHTPSFMNLSTHPDGYFVDDLGDPIPFVTTAPDFVDIDGDGDQDLMFGAPSGAVYLYRNEQVRGTSTFRFETDSYRDLVIIFGSCNPERRGLRGGPTPDLRHGFMLFSFHDVDGDLLPDMFVGDQFNSNVYYWENLGPTPSPDFVCRSERFFPDSTGAPGAFPQYLVPAFGDLDGDQDPDALLGPGTVAVEDRLWRFVNTGTPGSPSFTMQTGGFLPEFDLGRFSAAAFANLDGDEDLDLFLATGTSWRLSYFENVGTTSVAEFGLVAPSWIDLPGASWAAPEFADLDDDGDLDLAVGMTSGAVRLWRNDGGGADGAGFVEIVDDDFGDSSGRTFRTNVDSQAVPRFFDGDGDGDLDCLVGPWGTIGDARLLWFRNDGTAQTHDFVFASADYQGLGTLGMNLAPALGDIDHDGDPDLLVGKRDGTIELFRNRGSAAAPVFVPEAREAAGIDVGASAVPVLVDLDGDSDLDLVVGESGGGLNFFRAAGGPAPPAVALASPAADAALPGREATLFSWEAVPAPRGAGVTYDLWISPSPPPSEEAWIVRSGLSGPETSVQLFFEGLRFSEDFWWTAVARDGCVPGPVAEWRHGVHVGFEDDHHELLGEDFPRDAPAPPARDAAPGETRITGVFPTPARGSADVAFVVRRPGPARVEVYDLAGRRVAVLANGSRASGEHRVRWDGRTADGTLAASGVYLVTLQTADGTQSRRIVRLR